MIKTNRNQQQGSTKTSVFKLVNRPTMVESGYAQVISTISHELRTPVSILKSNIQILRMFSFEIDQELKDESLAMCEESVENIVHFLDDIQLLNSAGKTDIEPAFSNFNVKRIMYKQFVELGRQNLDCSRVSVHWDLDTPVVHSDLSFIQRILYNLLSNALKFSRDAIEVSISQNHQKLIISVADSGIGIPEEDIELIFKPFYRSENVKRRPGLGLGLAIVSTLSKCLRGEIYVSSILDQGTTLKIILPYETPK
jgi:signal transduction histidine kinase